MLITEPALEQLATDLAATLQAGDAVLLTGPLGAGKTTFCRAMIRAACGDPALEVPSPSYTLVQTYEARALTLHHFDLWRLDGQAAMPELGWDDAQEGVMLVEWPDRLGPLAPRHALLVALTVDANGQHAIDLTDTRSRR